MKRIFRAAAATVLVLSLNLSASAAKMLIPVGEVVGLSLNEGSVTVVAFDEKLGNCAREAGLHIGDEIETVNGRTIDSAQDLHNALQQSDGVVSVTVLRDGIRQNLTLLPQISQQGPKLGVYIREGITGIGTVTYFDPANGGFGALGHGVSSADGQLADILSGNIYDACVVSVKPGLPGIPGQLKGSVSAAESIGRVMINSSCGIYGTGCRWAGEALPAAQADQVHTGTATILSNVSGDAVEAFSVEILKVCNPGKDNGRDMLLQVTDHDLLRVTGGIVAGMGVSYNKDNQWNP